MADPKDLRLPKLAFYLGDLLLLALAGYLCWQGHRPLLIWEAWALVACVVLGGALVALPQILEYRAIQRLAETDRLTEALQRIQSLEQVSRQISSATAAWQAVQDDAGKAMTSARDVSERIAAEARAFQEFLQKSNDSERAHLRLETEKLRRAEGEFVHVLIRIMDHVYALYQAAVRSGNASLIDQIANFQRACRDTTRRVGLIPVAAQPGEAFDPEQHQAEREDPKPTPESRAEATMATGYRYQGILIRKALVVLRGDRPEPPALSIREIQKRHAEPPPAPETPPEAAAAQPDPEPTALVPTPEPVSASAPEAQPVHPTSEELPTEMIPANGRRPKVLVNPLEPAAMPEEPTPTEQGVSAGPEADDPVAVPESATSLVAEAAAEEPAPEPTSASAPESRSPDIAR